MLSRGLRRVGTSLAMLLTASWIAAPSNAATWTFESYSSTTGWVCDSWVTTGYPAPSTDFRACLQWNSTKTQVRGLYHIYNKSSATIGSGSYAVLSIDGPTWASGSCTGTVPPGVRRVCRTTWKSVGCGQTFHAEADFWWDEFTYHRTSDSPSRTRVC
jgi:hypothetical protein